MPGKRKHRRSNRRQIYCPTHACYLEGASRRYYLFADTVDQLRTRGVSRKRALLLYATNNTVSLEGEWLEKLWCDCCQTAEWYHVIKSGERSYAVSKAPRELWQQVSSVINAEGNPSVGEFTQKSARMNGYQGLKGFNFAK
jgi:hypothetical protein